MHVFFLQTEPDIDHLTPVVHRLWQKERDSVLIVLSNPNWNMRTDYRISFLIESCGVPALDIEDIQSSLTRKIRKFIRKVVYSLPFDGLWLYRRYLVNMYLNYRTKLLTSSVLVEFLSSFSVNSVTLDTGQPKEFIAAMSSAADQANVTLILYSSGPKFFVKPHLKFLDNGSWHTPESLGDSLKFGDFTIFEHRWGISAKVLDLNRTKIFGVPRFSKEWMTLNDALIHKAFGKTVLPENQSKLKVLVFAQSSNKFPRNHTLIKRLEERDDLCVLIKDKPRFVGKRSRFEKEPTNRLPSPLLIEWADVVVSGLTSVLYDALQRRKIVMWLQFINPGEKADFEKFEVLHVIKSEAQLLEALDRQIYCGENTIGNEKKIQQCITESINCGGSDEDILIKTYNFYRDLV